VIESLDATDSHAHCTLLQHIDADHYLIGPCQSATYRSTRSAVSAPSCFGTPHQHLPAGVLGQHEWMQTREEDISQTHTKFAQIFSKSCVAGMDNLNQQPALN
jgi:hypothetical protein